MIQKIPYFVSQMARAMMHFILSLSALCMALALITEPGNVMLSLSGSADAWGLALAAFGITLGIGLGFDIPWLLAGSSLACALWYFAITILLAFKANDGQGNWAIPTIAVTLAGIYTLTGIISLKMFGVDRADK